MGAISPSAHGIFGALFLALGRVILMFRILRTIVVMCAGVLAQGAWAQTAENPYFPVIVVDRDKGIFGIAGKFDFRTPLSFERVLEGIPNPRVLMLDSPGGSVHSALAIASRVKSMGIRTVVSENDGCYSACSMVFFAGQNRTAYGELGVHQISTTSGNDDLVSGQFALADIIDVLSEFDVPSQVMAIMLRTPPEDMYVFSRAENIKFGFFEAQNKRQTKPQAPAVQKTPAVQNKPTGGAVSASVDRLKPSTWRGKTIQGELVKNGKKWYSWLHSDGRTTFQTTKGDRIYGTYRITNGFVCYRYEGSTSEACRTPRRLGNRIGWYNTEGKYISYINSVGNVSPAAARKNSDVVASVSEHIKPGDCVLVVASRKNAAEARQYVLENIPDRRFLTAFKSQNGWVAITIGTLKPHEVDDTLERWKASGKIPGDSYCSTGKKYVGVVHLGFN